MLSSRGLRTIDVGQPQLSMHSIREMCAVSDLGHYSALFCAFYNEFSQVDESFDVDV
jgi:aspartyl aminopeptidase